jgi:hypothetical protein
MNMIVGRLICCVLFQLVPAYAPLRRPNHSTTMLTHTVRKVTRHNNQYFVYSLIQRGC